MQISNWLDTLRTRLRIAGRRVRRSTSGRRQRQHLRQPDLHSQVETVEQRTLLTTLAFGAAQVNPLGLADIGDSSAPTFVDIDGDGDLDLIAGDNAGNFRLFENDGSATASVFAAAQLNPHGLTDIGHYSAPSFGDIDGDGDLDLITGDIAGNFRLFTNNGSATAPAFGAPQLNPHGLIDIGYSSTPTLGDIDGDGDLDLITGDNTGNFRLFENTGSATAPAFDAPQLNPHGLADIGALSTPSFGDIDRDGDLDLIAGNSLGDFYLFENTGSATAIAFGAAQINPHGLVRNPGGSSNPSLGDVDGDGDLDLISGDYYGEFRLFENTAPAPATPAFGAEQVNPFGLVDIGRDSAPSLGDIDGDGDLDIVAGDYYGNFRLLENTSATGPAFAAPLLNPHGLADIDNSSAPALGDIDGDGDLDLIAGNYYGGFYLFKNTGDANAPAFGAAQVNPYGLSGVTNYSTPSLGDIDGDGDLDLLAGDDQGNFHLFKNTGDANAPAFGAPQVNPYGLSQVSAHRHSPSLGDIDGDGDLDIISGDNYINLRVFENTGSVNVPAFGAATASLPISVAIGKPSLGDIDGDGDLDVIFGNGTGDFRLLENTGAATTPADTEVTIAGGVLTITDVAGGDSNDDLTISYSGGTYTITDNGGLLIDVSSIAGSTDSGTDTVTVPDTGVTGILFAVLDGDDSVTVDSVQATALTDDFVIAGGTGTDTANINGVVTTGSGSINITAETITDDGSGSLSGDSVDLTADVIGSGTNPVNTATDDLTTDTSGANGAQFLTESNGLTDLDLNAGAGNVVLTLTAGNIVDSEADGDDVTARNASIILADAASHSVGMTVNPIETNVDSLSVDTSAGGGSMWLTEADALTDLNLNAGAGNAVLTLTAGNIVDSEADGDDVTARNASIILADAASHSVGMTVNPIETNVDSLTVDTSAGGGSMWLTEADALTDLNLNAGTGNVVLTLTAGNIVDSEADGDDVTASNASIILADAASHSVGMTVNPIETNVNGLTVDTSTGGGSMWLTEADALTDLNLNAGTGNVVLTLTAGNIVDSEADGDDVTARNASIILADAASHSVGMTVNPIETNVDSLTVDTSAGGGSMWLTEADTLTDLNLNAGTGNVVLTLTAGNIVDSEADGDDVTASNASIILADAASHSVGMTVNPIETNVNSLTVDTSTGGGSMWLTEADALTDLNLNAGVGNAVLTLTAGNIVDSEADGDDVAASNATIVLSDGTSQSVGMTVNPIETNVDSLSVDTSAGGGSMWLAEASGLTGLNLNAGTGNVDLTAGGAIEDGDANADVTGTSAALEADGGIGSTAALQTAVSTIAANNTTSGDIQLDNSVAGLLTIGTVSGVPGVTNAAAGAEVILSNLGAIQVDDTSAANDVSAGGHITLNARDNDVAGATDNFDLAAGAAIESTAGDVNLGAGDDFSLPATSAVSAPGGSININVDNPLVTPGGDPDGAPNMTGSTVDIDGALTSANGTTIIGGDDNDTFQAVAQPASAVRINGVLPVPGQPGIPPGDTLEFDVTGLTDPVLDLIPMISGMTGVLSAAAGTLPSSIVSIETLDIIGGTVDARLRMDLSNSQDLGPAPSANFPAGALPLNLPPGLGFGGFATGTGNGQPDDINLSVVAGNLQIQVASGALMATLTPELADVNSLEVQGSADDETLTVNNLADGFAGSLTFDGGAGADTVTIDSAIDAGDVSLTAETINLDGGDVDTTGDQNYNGDVLLGTTTSLVGTNVTFTGTVDIDTAGGGVPLTVTGDFAFGAGTTFEAEIMGTTPGTDQDRIGVTGAVDLNNALLTIDDMGFTSVGDEVILLIDNDGGDPVTGTFNGLPEGALAAVGGQMLPITYAGGDGNDVVLGVAIPPVVTIDPLTTTDPSPQLTGTISEDTMSIVVNVDGNDFAAANNGDGTWTLADDVITPDLAAGVHNVTVTATDLAGNVGTDATTNELAIAVLAFDFGAAGSPVESGHTQVLTTDVISGSPMAGEFGWVSNTGLSDRDRTNVPDDGDRDYHKTAISSVTFQAVIPNGSYDVTFTIGSGADPRNNVGVLFEGSQVATVTTSPGQFRTETHTVSVADGLLDLELQRQGSTASGINSLLILPATVEPDVEAADPAAFVKLGDPPIAIDAGLTVTDPDDVNLVGAEVRIVGGFVPGQDLLGFTDQLGITGGFDGATGVLTLAGTAPVADYQTALRTVTFTTTGTIDGPRTIQFAASDPTGTGFDARIINVTPAGGTTLDFDFGTAGSAVAAGFTPVEIDDAFNAADGYGWLDDAVANNISARDRSAPDAERQDYHKVGSGSMTFAVAVPDGTYDVTVTIGSNVDPRNGVGVFLEDTQVDTVSTLSGQFSTETHRVTVNDGRLEVKLERQGSTGISINSLRIAEVTTAPTVDLADGPAVFQSGGGAIAVDGGLTVDDLDSANLTGATVRISAGHNAAADTLLFTNQLGITGSYDAPSGVLTLTGSAPVADYQTALRSVQFDTTDNSGTRTISVTVDDGSDTGSDTRVVSVTGPFTGASYDFGTPTSNVESGFIGVNETTAFTTAQGYGWLSTTGVESRNRSAPVPLDERRDYNLIRSGSMTFAVSLPNGTYDVQVTVGSSENARTGVGILLEGTQVTTISTPTLNFAVETHQVTVVDNRLEIEIARQGPTAAGINALVITSVP